MTREDIKEIVTRHIQRTGLKVSSEIPEQLCYVRTDEMVEELFMMLPNHGEVVSELKEIKILLKERL